MLDLAPLLSFNFCLSDAAIFNRKQVVLMTFARSRDENRFSKHYLLMVRYFVFFGKMNNGSGMVNEVNMW